MIAKRRRLINFLTKVDKKRSTEIEKKIGFDKKPLEKTEKVEKVAKAEKAAKAKKTTKTK